MASVWPRPGRLQAGETPATLTNQEADHSSPSIPPPPCQTELRCQQEMNAPLESVNFAGSAKKPLTRNKRIADKGLVAKRDPWRKSQCAPQHRGCRPSPPSRYDHRKPSLVTPTPRRGPMTTLRRHSGKRRPKRSLDQGTIVRYTGYMDVKFRLPGDNPLYLTLAPSGSALKLSHFHTNSSCFRVHKFDEIPSNREGGFLVMLQVHGGNYLNGSASGLLSIVTSEVGVDMVSLVNSSFFRLSSYTGDNTLKIKHILTALHIQATADGVSLVSTSPLAAEGMLFHDFECT